MKALDYMTAPGVGEVPENKDAVLDIYEENDFDVADLRSQDSPWVLDGHLICPNLYFDEEAWDTTIETQELEEIPFSDNVDLSYLERAQELLDKDNTLTPDDLTYP
jgi:NitT/TauT family transport system substrate-binding protein